ncbi:hypothetical protein Daus18300_001887 [Diaporthe australafricana]|uniref:Mucin-7 n=1 Tax=Diaporthe australafricana TaxID=127596 RepID=A0ABR3XTJ8_9PEZI
MSVRNLRAMFENKTQESPPDRGRSPAGTESPRPLSKVRTSFVAIEKDGRIGLQQRNPSEASSISGRKLSGDTEAASSVQLDNTSTNVSSPTTSRSEHNRGPPTSSFHTSPPRTDDGSTSGRGPSQPAEPPASEDIISEPPREVASLASSGAPKGLAESPQIKENQNTSGRKFDQGSQARKAGQSQGAGDQGQGEATAPKTVHKESNGTSAGGIAVGSAVGSAVGGTVGSTAVGRTNGRTAAAVNGADKAKPTKPAAAAVAAAAAAPPSKMTSNNAVKPADPAPQPKPAGKPTNTTSQPPTTPKAVKPAAEKKPAPPSASPGGFVKPRPKSPTRPVKLPAGLTTHTSASGSRTRTSGSAPPSSHENIARSTSRSKASTKALARSSSAASRQRPSIGPPPKLPAKDHPVIKKDAKVDESFLARMMRPTQASASKVNEKAPITPPRRAAAVAPKKTASAKSVATRRPASKTTSTTTSGAPSPERTKKESSADRDIASVIEKMSIAGNVQETPKTPEREATIMEDLEEEKSGLIPVASAAPEASNEPEVEEADAPLANGAHKEETAGHASADIAEAKGKTEQAVSQLADLGAQPEQEEW